MRARMQPLVLRDGQVTELTVPLFRGGAIAGRVLDAHGDPDRLPPGARAACASRRAPDERRPGADQRPRRIPRAAAAARTLPRSSAAADESELSGPELRRSAPAAALADLLSKRAGDVAGPAHHVNRGETVAGLDMMLAEGVPTLVTGTVLQKRWRSGQCRLGEYACQSGRSRRRI